MFPPFCCTFVRYIFDFSFVRRSRTSPPYEAAIFGYMETTGVGVEGGEATDFTVTWGVREWMTPCAVDGELPCRSTVSKRPVPIATVIRSASKMSKSVLRFL